MLLQPHPTVADQSIARVLVPRLLAFVINTEPEDPENARTLVAHTLTQYATVVSKEHKALVMALVVPALLSRAASDGEEVYRETSARLLELAGIDQASFRGVVGGMSEGQKAFMEEVIKSGRQASVATRRSSDGAGQPSIALKMNFGV